MDRKTLVAFGYHQKEGNRHWSLCRWYEKQGYAIIECHTKARGFFAKCRDLLRQWRALPRKDALLVTYPGQYLVPLAWMITRFPRRRLVFDAFLSIHDMMVTDRKLVAAWHPRAAFLSLIDWLSCHLADDVLIDTEAHRQFFIHRFHLRPGKVQVVYLESRKDLFFPQEPTNLGAPKTSFDVLFCGSYIPLQGVDVILEAARIIETEDSSIRFTLVGGGQTYPAMRALASSLDVANVTFKDTAPLHDLPPLIRHADLCLGIFGTTPKAQRVIPHKVYDAVACGVPVITEDSPAIRERFENHPLVILCEAGNARMLADILLARAKAHRSRASSLLP